MSKATVSLYGALGAVVLAGCAASQSVGRMEVVPMTSVVHGAQQSEGYYQLGRYFQAHEKTDLAITALRKALALDASLVEAHNALGVLYAGQRDFAGARAEFTAAIALAPRAAHLYNNLGYALYLQGDTAAAITAFDQAAALDPANSRVWNNMGLAQAGAGELARSRDAFARGAVAAEPTVAGMRKERAEQTPAAGIALEVLALPKDRGIIRVLTPVDAVVIGSDGMAQPGGAAPVANAPTGAGEISHSTSQGAGSEAVRVVALAPNVFELQWPTPSAAPIAATPATTPPMAATYRLEVANGNGITGMARHVGDLLAAVGAPKARLTNRTPYTQKLTQIQYRVGYELPASALRGRMPGAPEVIASTTLRAGTDVRLVLGKDVAAGVALRDVDPAPTRVASVAQDASPDLR